MTEVLYLCAGAGRYEAPGSAGSGLYLALENILKGPEVPLPQGAGFLDKDGVRREKVRVRWWKEDAATYREIAFMPDVSEIPDAPLVPAFQPIRLYWPVFVGHYWLAPDGSMAPLSSMVACVDYRAGRAACGLQAEP